MHETEIDGVPVFWREAPGPLTAGLVFGCGTRDETFMTIGVTHLVEHLVMSALPRLHHEHNASVDLIATQFTATGRPEQIVSFLSAVCQGITEIPVGRLDQEAGVLEAESAFAVHPTGAALLTRRYGARDVGLEFYAGPGFRAVTADSVRAHAARFLVAGNAALWLTGPPPAGMRLSLPPGERVRGTEPQLLPQDGPRWSQEQVPDPGLLLSGDRAAVWSLAMSILEDRVLAEARHRRGLSYAVFGDVVPVGPRARQYLMGLDAREGQDAEVATILWTQLGRLAGEGPTEEELAHAKEDAREAYSDPRWPVVDVANRAHAHLFDFPIEDGATRLAETMAVGREDVAQCLAAALPNALIAVPPGVEPRLPGVEEGGCPRTRTAPSGEVFAMRPVVRLLAGLARAPRICLTVTGLAQLDPDGSVHETDFADVVGVDVDGGTRILFAANGCVIPVPTEGYQDGDLLRSAIDNAVPAHLHYVPEGAKPAAADPVGQALLERPRPYRRGMAVFALVLALGTADFYYLWHIGRGPLWWVVVGAIVTVVIAWEARPRRRRIRTMKTAPGPDRDAASRS